MSSITSGNLSNQWNSWKKSFLIYFKACQLHTKDKDVQVSILLHIIGEQCREVSEQFTNESNPTVENLLKKFDVFFTPKKNLTVERHKFFTRNQLEYESVEQYVFELNKLALSCEFITLKDDLVKDRLICGLKDDGLRERLLREYDLTLTKALDICNIAEMSRMQASKLSIERDRGHVDEVRERDRDTEVAVHWVQRPDGACGACKNYGRAPSETRRTPAGGGHPRHERQASAAAPASTRPMAHPYQHSASSEQRQGVPLTITSSGTPRQNRRNTCEYCGGIHIKFKCPAYGQRCAKCKRMNHFARVCRVYTVQENSIDQVRGDSYSDAMDDWCQDVVINNSQIKFKLDTGADVNVLPRRFLLQAGVTEDDLMSTSVKLVSYSGGDIQVLGKCRLKCICKDKQYIVKFIVADVTSPPVLGKKSCDEMNLVKRVLAVSLNSAISGNVLDEYPEVFEGVGCLPCEYRIKLAADARPVVHAPRKLPIALRDSVKRKLDEMLDQGVIAKVEGPTDWVNSMTVVQKPNGDIRICLDPRDLNKYIKREHFKLPTLDEITAKLSGAKYFSSIDCKHSFWQLRLHNESTDLCTFNTAFGRFKFLRMPFGISSASEVFHKRLYEYFDDIEGVILFVDDLLCYADTKELHDIRLRQVLDRCKEINIKLNRDKCNIGLTEIKYLGHIITQSGIRPDDSHILPIQNMPKPENVKDLERFLGLVTYVGNFIPNLSEKTHKLRELLKKDIEWHWDDEHDRCFGELQRCITNPPVLRFYSLDKPVTISVDASKNGLGACLMQDGMPVCFASRSLTRTEQNYAQIEKELYACVFACEKFYTYIYGRSDITVETDHKPLISIINKPIAGAPARLQRMLVRLQPYTFELVYKPGRYLYIADTLSRAVAPSSDNENDPRDYLDVKAQVCAIAASNSLTDTHFVELQKMTGLDEEMQELKRVIKDGWPVHKSDIKDIVAPYWDSRDELTMAYDLVWKGTRIVIPKCMRKDMLKKVHIGHLGVAKTKLRAREVMFWPSMNAQIQDMISHCQPCLTHRKENCKQPLIPHEIPTRAWEKIGADIFHFNNNSYLLIIDYFSKFVEVEKLNNLTSQTVIDKLKKIFSRQGIPEEIFSDNGPEFASMLFREFSREWRFVHTTSSPRYPQSNGQVERAIQTVKSMLQKTLHDKSDFRLALLEFLNTPISDKLPSPSELLNSRKLRSLLPRSRQVLEPRLHDTNKVKNELRHRQIVQKKYFDRGSKNLKPLEPGNKVKVRMGKSWVDAEIINITGPRSYAIKLNTGNIIRRNRKQIILDSCLRRDRYESTSPDCYDDIISGSLRSSGVPQQVAETNNNNYVTRSGRTVRAPDRWGFS